MGDAPKESLLNEGVRVKRAPSCYLSGEEGELVYQGLRDWLFQSPGTWDIRRSPHMPFFWIDPRPDKQDLGKLYAGYHTQNPTSLSFLSKRNRKKWRLRKIILSGIRNYPGGRWSRIFGKMLSLVWFLRGSADRSVMWLKGPTGRLLDVGCGNGRFLKKMEFMGWNVTGVELDKTSADAARGVGLEVHDGTLDEQGFAGETFQAISMVHVIEHLLDPIETLKECYRLLTPGGQLVLITPNVLSLGHSKFQENWRGLEVPRHVFLYSPQSLSFCVEQAGLKVTALRTEYRPARGIMRESMRIRRLREIGDEPIPRAGLKEKFATRVFQWWEAFRCIFSPVGEEIVLIAEKK